MKNYIWKWKNHEAVYNSMSDDKSFNYKIECFCVENIKKNKFLGLPNYDFETIEKNFLHQNIFSLLL